ncbi:hypothetical protein LXA43DRAFT_900516 [Ganoderma leucocontextum]|nr:hypothetical protein LXA43DRAFT_900516 [Ganoderma leucocontextum]
MSARDTTLSTSRASTPHSDDDPGDVLRIQRERYTERIRELQRVPEQITEAYRDAWQRFYVWEPQYCEVMLRGLRDVTPSQSSTVSFSDFISDSFDLSDMGDSMEEEADDDSLSYQQWFADDERSISIFGVAEEFVVGSRRHCFTSYAYAKYEACTPALQNIKHDLDVRILQFIPYADEPGFLRRIKSYARMHAIFAWQHSWYDVDFKLVALEAIWRLHDAELSLETMDRFPVDFFPLAGGQSGLIASMHHRDLIDWGGSVPSTQLSDLRRPQSPFLGKSVDNMTAMFCASMNCVESLCMLHRPHYPPFDLDSAESHNNVKEARACGPNCFRMAYAEQFPVCCPPLSSAVS